MSLALAASFPTLAQAADHLLMGGSRAARLLTAPPAASHSSPPVHTRSHSTIVLSTYSPSTLSWERKRQHTWRPPTRGFCCSLIMGTPRSQRTCLFFLVLFVLRITFITLSLPIARRFTPPHRSFASQAKSDITECPDDAEPDYGYKLAPLDLRHAARGQ